MVLRIGFWIAIALGLAVLIVYLGATLSPEGSAFQEGFQGIIDAVSEWWE